MPAFLGYDSCRFVELIDAMPLVSVDLIVIRDSREVLLGLRNNRPARGYWFVPGGRIRKCEHIVDARLRIARCELGDSMALDHWRLVGAFDHIYPDNFSGQTGVSTHYVALGFRCDVSAPRPEPKADDQHALLAWVPIERALEDPHVHENTKAYLR